MQMKGQYTHVRRKVMDPNANNQGNVPPPNYDPGQTLVVPTQVTGTSQGFTSPGATEAPRSTYAPALQPGSTNGTPYPDYSQYSQPVARNDRDRTLLALILIGAGALFLFDQLNIFRGIGDFVLLVVGGVFLYAYFNTRQGYRIGFLIPGAILLGIGAGQVISHLPVAGSFIGDNITAVTMGLGFCLIWLLERKLWWALIPGGILLFSGLASVVGNLWPLALIAVGVYLIYDPSRRRPAH
jgi:hypothetical protein